MNYKIIKDEDKLKKFIEWLPNLKDGEQFYLALFARSKYDKTNILKSDKSQLARTTSTKDRLFDKIRKMECPVGSYKINGVEDIPLDTLALYIHPTPRSMKNASIKTAKMILDNIGKDRYQNPKSIALNAIQVSKSGSFRVDFDFDISNKNYDKHIKDIVYEATGNIDCFDIVQTKGGYHVLVDPSKTTEKRWYQNMMSNKNVDQAGDLLLPVPGCCQGDFTPKFI
ncbi:MAG: hypothetical protein CMH22_05585 [Methylophaga sp.]|nr:hypothetical protein [Methylophaga sp.]|tara:strand:+ start:109615 stop:110292 length:678 start_codon:yes stop_codon:yes gene_type:complete